jgi:xylulokinase
MYLLGFDLGSSSVKAALVDARTGVAVATAQSPDTEMPIDAPQPGWAEQHPDLWWEHAVKAAHKLWTLTKVAPGEVRAIGIAYQMHGLVTLDADFQPVRPAIIWCDSRAVAIGEHAFTALGPDYCLRHYLNSPGNFTASKLKWVRDHEPDNYARTRHIALPGDYLACRMTGRLCTTVSGLSEGILWDFQQHNLAESLCATYGINPQLVGDIDPTFGQQGALTAEAAAELGLEPGIPVAYRAGDQPNNALSLNVLQPGEVAATGGTSGVVYAVTDKLVYDPQQRVNSFAHVNHTAAAPRIGVLLCINGAGILYGWMRKNVAAPGSTYPELEALAAQAPIGADGISILPFGNGAERMLANREPGAHILGLSLTRHDRSHLLRATLEGIAFAFIHGMKALQELGIDVSLLRVGNDNLFQSAIFSNTIAHVLGCRIEMLRTNGAVGAAIAAGAGIGMYPDVRTGLGTLSTVHTYEPDTDAGPYQEAYARWAEHLGTVLK